MEIFEKSKQGGPNKGGGKVGNTILKIRSKIMFLIAIPKLLYSFSTSIWLWTPKLLKIPFVGCILLNILQFLKQKFSQINKRGTKYGPGMEKISEN